jgi:hypothetical protein
VGILANSDYLWLHGKDVEPGRQGRMERASAYKYLASLSKRFPTFRNIGNFLSNAAALRQKDQNPRQSAD